MQTEYAVHNKLYFKNCPFNSFLPKIDIDIRNRYHNRSFKTKTET